jgi:hypothetical protein
MSNRLNREFLSFSGFTNKVRSKKSGFWKMDAQFGGTCGGNNQLHDTPTDAVEYF